VGPAPVERLERISRERDRPSKQRQQQARRDAKREAQPGQSYRDDEGNPHIDVRV
jgi:hypothetical protein